MSKEVRIYTSFSNSSDGCCNVRTLVPLLLTLCGIRTKAGLHKWTKKTRKSMKFAVIMIWREITDHSDDCYFCLLNLKGVSKKKRKKLVFPTLSSALRPVPHNQNSLPVPVFTELPEISPASLLNSSMSVGGRSSDPDFLPQSIPMLFTQMELNDSVRYLNLPEKAAELISSRLK